MNFPSVLEVSEAIDIGTHLRYEFNIVNSNQEYVIREILYWIKPNIELSLADHRRDDYEGTVSIAFHNNKLKFMRGGHGYSSDWFNASTDELFLELLETLKATKYDNLLGYGSININKSYN